jgi:dATP pyrophosphohydrolase
MTDYHKIPIYAHSVSVVVVRNAPGRAEVLLLLRAGPKLPGLWCQVAGVVEANETAWQAALRELREETALTPVRFYSADICEQFYESSQNAIILVPVFVAFVAADAEVVMNKEHERYEWLSFDEARQRVTFPGQRQMLRRVEVEFVLRTPGELLRIDV